MKISIETAAAGYLNKVDAKVKNRQTSSVQDTGRNFDQIMINSNSRQIAEDRLTTAAKKEITGAVYQKVSDEKIAALKEQVAQGMYKVDPEAVAAKILLLGE